MESNVVKFILENIYLFLPIGILGISITLYLYYTGKKEDIKLKDDLKDNYLVFSKFNINIYVLIYLFILTMMIIIGLLSNLIIPIIIGGFIALIPIVAFFLTKIKTKNFKG